MRIPNRQRTISEMKLAEIRENVLEQREKVTDVQEIAVYATE